ncbi:MAG: LptF/LptG family permease [Planctomycetota bacterium]|nr:LptF/LptG family permease [Planctomycetota bacterium]
MAKGLPVTMWRSVLGELWRLLLLSVGILVLVLAFAGSIKPLADGKLQPTDVVKFIGFLIPPMLAYALPFAGCFAATLTYHRLATDNEVTAAAASGVSHRNVLTPAIITGLVLALALGALNDRVIPWFLRSAAELVTQNIARLLMRSIEAGDSIDVGPRQIYADKAIQRRPDPASGASDELVLFKPAMIELDAAGRVIKEGTAQKATVWVVPGAAATGNAQSGSDNAPVARVYMRLENVVANEVGKFLATQQEAYTLEPWTVPNAFKDDPKYLSGGELRELGPHPERINWIDALRRQIAMEQSRAAMVTRLSAKLGAGKSLEFIDLDARRVEVRAGSLGAATNVGKLMAWPILPAQGEEEVIVTRSGGGVGSGGSVRLAARTAMLVSDPDAELAEGVTRFALQLSQVRASGGRDGELGGGSVRERFDLKSLASSEQSDTAWLDLSTPELMDRVTAAGTNSWMIDELRKQLADLRNEVLSKQHERLAMAVSCAVMVLTGAITALRLSKQMPLTVYLWSFFPALVSVITIAGGQQTTHRYGPWGLVLLWGGVGILALYTVAAFWSVRKH